MNENISVSENDYSVDIPVDDGESVVVEQEIETDGNVDDSNVDVELPEDEFEIQEETSEDFVEIVETVSGGDISDGSMDTPVDNSSSIQDYSEIITKIEVLQDSVDTMNIALTSVNMFLACILFFTVFKWCEQKIKSFRKGFSKR